MGAVIELVMLFAALLTDVLLGNYGFAPCLTMFVLFHSSRCVSLRFATIGSLILGTLIDLWYDRAASGTPLWYVLALYAGQAALFRRDEKYRWLQLIDNCYFLYLHQHQFSKEERAEARRKIASARKDINTSVLPSSLTRKFGYWPCSSFGLFMLQEWMYFTLRKLTGRL